MGADLYYQDAETEARRERARVKFDAAVLKRNGLPPGSTEAAKAQEEVAKAYARIYGRGYFRDSYNASSVLWRLGLSWWNDIIPMVSAAPHPSEDESSIVLPEGLPPILELIKSRKPAPVSMEWAKEHHAEATGPEDIKAWNRRFRLEHRALIRFLSVAIERKITVSFSL